jgi:S-formylglutathione hydrolase FrmB
MPGASLEFDADELTYPSPISEASPGDYLMQALLDVNHSYNYVGRASGDVVSEVMPLLKFSPGTGVEPELRMSRTIPIAQDASLPEGMHLEDFISPSLTGFYHRPIHMRAIVVDPPSYVSGTHQVFPACYFTQGFTGTLDSLPRYARILAGRMRKGTMPPMFWILLDESLPTGTHEFADSANNGPWGRALTTEFIPYLEKRFRLDPRAKGRFLNGHSSGGWATLWLQVAYPKVFGGTWSTSPDPSDFHDFSGIDLYAKGANLYHQPDGSAYPIVRAKGHVVATVEQFAKQEEVLGPIGGQFSSFEWVFSPRGPDGAPLQMFHRGTGDVNTDVVAAWRRYDIVAKLKTEWPATGSDLNGKIHVYVGTADTFYLDGAAHKLSDALKSLGAQASVTFLEGRTHGNVYWVGDDHDGLFDELSNQMYATWKAAPKPRAIPGTSHRE